MYTIDRIEVDQEMEVIINNPETKNGNPLWTQNDGAWPEAVCTHIVRESLTQSRTKSESLLRESNSDRYCEGNFSSGLSYGP